MKRMIEDDEFVTPLNSNIDIDILRDGLGIFNDMVNQQSQLSLKRRYLMGLSTLESVDQNTNPPPLPESLLRQDDLFYDHVKLMVDTCFQGCHVNTQNSILPRHKVFPLATILTLLDEFSNVGLCNVAKIFTGGVTDFVGTRPQMKSFIKSSLVSLQSGRYPRDYLLRLQNELSQQLNSRVNFHNNYRKHVKLTLKELRVDIMKVLDGVKDMKLHTLTAMYRILKGSKQNGTQSRCGSSRKPKAKLVNQIRNLSLDMIQQLDESDELQKPLAKALSVVGFSLKIGASSSRDVSVPKFRFLEVTPEIEMLQDEIVKAIQLLDQRISKKDMMKLRNLLDPDSEAEGKTLKSAIRNTLTEFLFECIDVYTAPDSLLSALSLINKRRLLSKGLMNEEVECILNVSAYLKQLLCESNPIIGQFDQDFVDAYMEEEESDDGDIFDDSEDDQKVDANSKDECGIGFNESREEVGSTSCANDQKVDANSNDECGIGFHDFKEEVGSTSYADDASFDSPCETNLKYTAEDVCSDTETGQAKNNSSPLPSSGLAADGHITTENNMNSSNSRSEQILMSGNQNNSYIAIQEVCDNTSGIAYKLIGHMLSEFGRLDGLGLDENQESYLRGGHFGELVSNSKDKDVCGSTVVEAVHKVLPLFPKSELEMLNKFMSS